MEQVDEKKVFGFISSSTLHIIAMLLMLSDHLWATIFPYMEWMTCIGRIAFPIFAFMIVEGYFHTHDFKKYFLRMLCFAVVSEIPFDLVYGNSIFYPYHQNVLWTFLIALAIIHLLEKVKAGNSLPKYILASVGAALVGMIIGTLTMVDYYGVGVWVVLMFYFCRKRTPLNLVLQLVFMYVVFVQMIGGYYYPITIFGHEFEFLQEAFSLLALIPIWLYNGKKGYKATWFKYFCYGFYPGHFLILYVIWQLLLKM